MVGGGTPGVGPSQKAEHHRAQQMPLSLIKVVTYFFVTYFVTVIYTVLRATPRGTPVTVAVHERSEQQGPERRS